MKYLIIILLFTCSTPVVAMNAVQEKLRQTVEVTAECDDAIARYTKLIKIYTKRVAALKAEIKKTNKSRDKRRLVVAKLKLFHFKAQLQNEQDYCNGTEDTNTD